MRAILFILHSLLTLIVIAFLLRLVIPLGRGSLRNTLGQAVMRVTDPIVLPLRKLFKPIGRFDVAALLALLLVQFAGKRRSSSSTRSRYSFTQCSAGSHPARAARPWTC